MAHNRLEPQGVNSQITGDNGPLALLQDDSPPSWFMDNELTHLLMQSVLDIAMPIAQTQFIDCLKKLAKKLKDEGKF